MDLLIEGLIAFLIVGAGFFGIVGSFGLAKLPDLMTRLHGPTKATTLGIGGVLIASMLFFLWERGHFSWHELLITLFLFLTAPITANFIAKSFLHRRMSRRTELPPTGSSKGWATFDGPPIGADGEPMAIAPADRPGGRDGERG
ncbi:MAG: Na+/H+ antiporter subunit G [Alphaproteobacteria bacterium]|nr:Na+/H+ antiporter subunit G [Alphaproteobacteria bacterium]